MNESQTSAPRFLRRKLAAAYVRDKHGIPCSPGWLAKLAVIGGGPLFRKNGRVPIYEPEHLDEWAESRISRTFRSTSEFRAEQRAA